MDQIRKRKYVALWIMFLVCTLVSREYLYASEQEIAFQAESYKKDCKNRTTYVPIYTKEEQDVIKAYPKLVVEIEPWGAPVQYIDSETGEGKGIVVDLLDEISKLCGIEFEYVPSVHDTGQCRGSADLYAGYHKDRYGIPMYLTDAILSMHMVFVGPSVLDLSKSLTAGIARLDSVEAQQIKKRYPNIEIKEYHSMHDVSAALLKEKTDLAITSLYTFNELIKHGNEKNYVAYPTGVELGIKLGIAKDLPEDLVTIINKARAALSEDEIESIIFYNTLEHVSKVSIEFIIKRNIIVMLLIIILLVSIIVIILYGRKKALQKVAYEDTVTGLSTLAKFTLDVAKKLEHAKPGEYVLFALDVANFSYINNWVGYKAGNKVLKALADSMKVELGHKALLARECSDVFLILMKASDVIEKEAINGNGKVEQSILELKKLNHHITFNIGRYRIMDLDQDIYYMIDCANIARKKVKGQYGDALTEYTEELNAQLQKQQQIVLEMEQALCRHEFTLFLQPKIHLLTESMQGAEALVRWYRSNGEVVYPDDFIPLFEQNGFILYLDLYMFEEVCKLINTWQQKGIHPLPRVSVNISKVTLLSENLCDQLITLTKKWQVSTQSIELELTESAFSQNMERTGEVVLQLKALGFYISLDDFGSGYSSLNMLKDINVDVIKIDKAFLNNPILTNHDIEIIRSIVDIAKILKLETVIEGVELKDQVDTLREIGCNLAQGYYFDKPLTPEAFETYFSKK